MSINRVYVENIAQLIELVKEDKLTQNASTYLRDRYPIRFVLFDNFNDSFEFVSQLMDCGCILKSVEDWVDPDFPDIMLTYNDLSRRIKNFIQNETLPSNDYVIAPFSELARFYDNNERKTFESLLRTIKGIESTSEAWNNHQRIYIPIVGLEGKMQSILPDTQIIIWQLKSDKQSNYNLILCHELYGVKGLEKNYTLINNVHDWLQYWKNSVSKEHKSIISISEAIMANAEYAQPDNAFEYKICTDIYCFLTRGLNLDFGELKYSANDEYLWRRLAEDIDLSKDFDLNEFVFEQFSVTSIDDYKTFIKIWFEYPSEYDRWLLSGFYRTSHEDYISKILSKLDNYKDTELVHLIALERSSIENEIIARKYCLDFSYSKNVRLTVEVENLIANQLCALGIQQGYETAVRYFTRISRKERQLAIEWIGKGYIKPSMIQHCFPELYTYLDKSIGTRKESQKWCLPYIDEYKKAKISNTISDELSALINEINNDEISFSNWYNDFKTTRTILQGRDDIDVYYWIDGLGIDWMPYISDLIKKSEHKGMYLNEIMIARSSLPTTTEKNKVDLDLLSNGEIANHKIGNLDGYAHQRTNIYPDYIINELEIVSTAIKTVIDKFNGKKIAIVSDHGLSYMPQLASGMNMSNIEPDHNGRLGFLQSSKATSDSNYTILDDGKTICALKYKSLSSKVPAGLGAHRGCTPEEVLVPIFIVSSDKNAVNWKANIISSNVSANKPVVSIEIKNAPIDADIYLIYDGKRYEMSEKQNEIFESEELILNADVKRIALYVGPDKKDFHIDFSKAADVDDNMFDF